MRQVVIGIKDGKPYVVAAPKKITVVFKPDKKRSIKKRIKTLWWHLFHRSA